MRFTAAIGAGAVLFGALMLHGLAGPAAPAVRLISSLAALAVVLVFDFGSFLRARWLVPRSLAFSALVGTIVLVPSVPVRGIAYALAVLVLSVPGLGGAPAGLFLASAGTSLAAWIPGAARLGTTIATALGTAVRPSGASALEYGPSAAGLPAILFALAMIAARAARGPTRWTFVGAALVLPVSASQWALAETLHDRFGPFAGHGHEPPLFASLSFLAVFLAAAVSVSWLGPIRPEGSAPPARWARPALSGIVIGAASLVFLAGWRWPAPDDRRVAFLNVGGFDWKRPTVEELGVFSSGMFGLLPVYLEDWGWRVRTVDLAEVRSLGRRDAQILVLINCHHVWEEPERIALEAFLREGGSILVLGDHTDVFGLMRGFNSLLEPWGIRYHFDSAYHSGRSWRDDVEWKPGLLGLWRDPLAAGIGIGASLEIVPPARTIVAARYGFGDEGMRDNVVGAFLGDYEYEPGERLGDLVLVAMSQIGQGRVVVYGDTSGFQNGSLSEGFATHVEPLFRSLSRRPRASLPYAVEATIAVLLLLLAAWAALVPKPWRWAALAGAGGAFVVGGAIEFGSRPTAEEGLLRARLERSLVIDDSHFPDVGHREAAWNVIHPLESAAFRAGMTVYHASTWREDVARGARVQALVGSRLPLGDEEVNQLAEAMSEGGTVLVATSGGDSAGAKPLLRRFGVDVSDYRLGSIPTATHQREEEPRLVDLSPITLPAESKADVLFRYGDLILAASVPVGRGWLVVVGDTRFFSEQNTEGPWGWWGGNLRFLHDIMLTYCGGDPSRSRAVFSPPVPPDE